MKQLIFASICFSFIVMVVAFLGFLPSWMAGVAWMITIMFQVNLLLEIMFHEEQDNRIKELQNMINDKLSDGCQTNGGENINV